MTPTQKPVVFHCNGSPLVGMLHVPSIGSGRVGVLIVVGGGPQYRVGGHRQLVLWSRRLAARGYPVLRFDYRGMGDSGGDFAGFEDADEDIRAAIDCFLAQSVGVEDVILWGECDAASAMLFYAYRDARVKGLVLLNPWAHTEAGRAKAVLRHYYLQRILQPSFWRKLLGFRFNPLASLKSALSLVASSRAAGGGAAAISAAENGALPRDMPLPEKLWNGYARFKGPVLLVMSGRDIIAREFDELIKDSQAWTELMASKPTSRHDIKEADHTFSSAELRERVVGIGLDWLSGINRQQGGSGG